jgi:uncharacterized membrane protein
MPDPVDPTQPVPPPISGPAPTPAPTSNPAPAPEVNASTTGLPSNVAAAIACIPLVGGIIFYVLEKRDGFVRFYAMQSIIFGGAWLLFNVVYAIVHVIFASVPAVGGFLSLLWGLVGMLIHLAFVVIWIIATIKAFTNVRWDIPYVGPMARKQFEGTSV